MNIGIEEIYSIIVKVGRDQKDSLRILGPGPLFEKGWIWIKFKRQIGFRIFHGSDRFVRWVGTDSAFFSVKAGSG